MHHLCPEVSVIMKSW